MIWPNDAVTLAYTKLRTRRVRHIVVIIISSLLFILISSVLFVVRGTLSSIEKYMESGFASRYIITATRVADNNIISDKNIINRAKVIQKELIKQKAAEAKSLDIPYDQNSEPLIANSSGIGSDGSELISDVNYAPTAQAIREYYEGKKINVDDELKKLGSGYGIKSDIYKQVPIRDSYQNYYLQILEKGKESYDLSAQNSYDPNSLSYFSQSYSLLSGDLLKPFLLEGQNLEIGSDGSIPIFVPYQAAQKLTNTKELEKSATTRQKADYLKEMRSKSAGLVFEVCYRNQSSYDTLKTAITEGQDYNSNKDKKNYVKPDLVRDLPKEKCGPATVIRDVRTNEQKTYDIKLISFDRKFGKEPEEQQILKYRVVGLLPSNNNNAFSVQQLLESILSSSIGNNWFSPLEISKTQPLIQKFVNKSAQAQQQQYFVELSDVRGAKKFITEKGCAFDAMSMMNGSMSDPYAKCKTDGKYYSLTPFGGNAIAISEFKTGFYKFFRYVIFVLGVFAAIILLGVVSRVIADSRREVAVFRAIGAKRLDIAQIYLTYALMIGAIISSIAILSGIGIGMVINSKLAADMSISSSIVFNTPTIENGFKLYAVAIQDVLTIVGAVFATCVLSALLPIAANSRRNPISDMRDER